MITEPIPEHSPFTITISSGSLWERQRVQLFSNPQQTQARRTNREPIGVHHSENGAYYANPVEFGHGGPAPAPAHPFVRPAFDTRADEAFSEIKRVLRDELKNR